MQMDKTICFYFNIIKSNFSDRKSFIGTTRYAAIAAHKGYELSRKDDLESFFYVLMYFLRGYAKFYKL